jgi:hypothetical protein
LIIPRASGALMWTCTAALRVSRHHQDRAATKDKISPPVSPSAGSEIDRPDEFVVGTIVSIKKTDPNRGELLVAIMNAPSDWEILKTQGWYRIPVSSAPKRWPPQQLALFEATPDYDLD